METSKNYKTGCVLCSQNCGIEIEVNNNRIVRVMPDKKNPRSKGYICRKGLNVANYQHHKDRLKYPLKKTEHGFSQVSWDQAISEIADRLRSIVDQYGPRTYAYMGGGGQGCHFEGFFGSIFMRQIGSRYHYNALAQELTGYFWVAGRMMGAQNRFPIADEAHADMILSIGWNGMESHQMPRAPLILKEFSQNPNKILAVIDPRMSETARIANIHLPIRPCTDALFTKAIIAIILQQGWEKRSYLKDHISGFEKISAMFKHVDVRQALEVCQLQEDQVMELCRLLSTRNWCLHADLGTLMNRHSTATSYLQMVLLAICGRLCVPGGNIIPGSLVPLGLHTDERDPNAWRTIATGFPAISGVFPPNVMPEEIMSDHPERLRAVIVCGSNPLRSYADTTAYETAFKRLDLLVTIELAMTETAVLSDYVLPARSAYESWDGAFFAWTFPEIYFQMRRPIIEPEGEPLECGDIFTRLADAMGFIPQLPQSLYLTSQKDHLSFSIELAEFFKLNPTAMHSLPFILAKTLGNHLKSAHLSFLWGLLQSLFYQFHDSSNTILDIDAIFLKMSDGTGLIPDVPETMSNAKKKGIISLIKEMCAYAFTEPHDLLAIPYLMTKIYGFERVVPYALGLWALPKFDVSSFFFNVNRGEYNFKKALQVLGTPTYLKHMIQHVVDKKNILPLMALNPLSVIAEMLFEAICDHPEGLILGEVDMQNNMKELRTKNSRIDLCIPELIDWVQMITPESETNALTIDPNYPLILMAGRHIKTNANTLMRNPEWNKELRACTLAMHPNDAAALNLTDGQQVKVITEAGEEKIELEITNATREGQVIIPHGFGLHYDGKKYGANVNRLTKNTHRDPLAATPLHRYVPCRVEAQ